MPENKTELSELLHGAVTDVSLALPKTLSEEKWIEVGHTLFKMGHSVAWWIGDWWAFGEHTYGSRKALTQRPDWNGPKFQTCMDMASVCRKFETSLRREVVSFSHHKETMSLPKAKALEILDWCEEPLKTGGKVRSVREMVKRIKLGPPKPMDPLFSGAKEFNSATGKVQDAPSPSVNGETPQFPIIVTEKEAKLADRGVDGKSSLAEQDKAARAFFRSLRKRGFTHVETDRRQLQLKYGKTHWR